MRNLVPHITMNVIIYPYWDFSYPMLAKEDPGAVAGICRENTENCIITGGTSGSLHANSWDKKVGITTIL